MEFNANPKRTERVHIRTTKEIKDMLIEISEKQDISVAQIIDGLVSDYYYSLKREKEELKKMQELYGDDFEY